MSADFTAVNEALNNLTREVGETAAVVRDQAAQIEELKSKVSDPTVQAELDNIAARLNEQAAALDQLQSKPEPPAEGDGGGEGEQEGGESTEETQ